MKETLDIAEIISVPLATALGIVNIEQILGIVLLVLQVLIVIVRLTFKIIDYAKDKKISKEEAEDIINELENIKDIVEETRKEDK